MSQTLCHILIIYRKVPVYALTTYDTIHEMTILKDTKYEIKRRDIHVKSKDVIWNPTFLLAKKSTH